MSQIGIPKYKDLLNNVELNKIKDYLNIICIDFANLTSENAVKNREDDRFEIYTNQYSVDMIKLKDMALRTQELQNKLNDILFTISTRLVNERLQG